MSLPLQTPLAVYTGTGTAVQFAYNWYVIAAADLIIKLNQVVQTPDKYTVTGAGNITGGNVTFLTAPAAGVEVVIQRVTIAERDTNYINNGDLLAETLNSDFDRIWMKLQDTAVTFGSSITKPTGSGVWDAQGFRLGNLADGTQPQDAATFKQLTDTSGSASASATAAAASADTATTQAGIATTQATIATTQAGIATTQATAASASAASALSSKNAAGVSATSAAADSATATTQAGIATNKASAADASAVAAAASAALAQQYQPNTALQIMPVLSSTINIDTLFGTTMNGRYPANAATAATTARGFPVVGFIGYVDVSPAGVDTLQIAYQTTGVEYIRYRSGGAWSAWATVSLLKSNNLSDLASLVTARTNLDVYSKAEVTANTYNDTASAASAWTAPTPMNGWVVNTGAGGRTVYRKVNGLIYVEVNLANGTQTGSTVLFTLPAWATPSTNRFAVSVGLPVNPCVLFVTSAGEVKLATAAGGVGIIANFCYSLT